MTKETRDSIILDGPADGLWLIEEWPRVSADANADYHAAEAAGTVEMSIARLGDPDDCVEVTQEEADLGEYILLADGASHIEGGERDGEPIWRGDCYGAGIVPRVEVAGPDRVRG